MKKIISSIIFFIMAGTFSVVYAAPAPIITSTQDRSGNQDHSFGIGLTTSVAQRPFVGVDDQNASLLYLSYRYKDFYVEGLDIGLNLINNENYSLDILGTPRFYEVEPAFADNGELNNIDITKPSYFAGFSSQIKSKYATYTFQILQDLIESDGNELVAQVSKNYELNSEWSLTPSFGLVYQSNKLVDYYYGVQSNEVVVGRPLYEGKSALNYNLTLNALWKVTENVELLGQVKYEVLGDGITDSPIVDEDSTYFFTVGAVYRFK